MLFLLLLSLLVPGQPGRLTACGRQLSACWILHHAVGHEPSHCLATCFRQAVHLHQPALQ